jgi:hypothetical protein
MILGLAIAISQIRSMGRAQARSGLVGTLGVLFFYSLIMVLDSHNLNWSIADYGSFLLNLFVPFPR